MASNNTNTSPKQIVQNAQSLYILLGKNPSVDAISAALATYQQLKQSGKTVFLASPSPVNIDLDFPGLEEITQEIGNRNLVISLKLPDTEVIDKVSYNINEQDKTFNLIVQPKKDSDPLKANDVNYSYTGADAEAVIIINARNYQDLGHFYEEERKLFDEAETIEITPNATGKFTNHQFTGEASSYAETAYQFLQTLDITIDSKDAATNLLVGIDATTNQLQHPSIKPETFETVAQLVRVGGQRMNLQSAQSAQQPSTPAGRPRPAMPPQPPSGGNVPQDWLTPKVYKGAKPSRQ